MYADFRARREEARASAPDASLSGHDLAGTLTSYSERGEEYVRTLRSIIETNSLSLADSASLKSMEPVYYR